MSYFCETKRIGRIDSIRRVRKIRVRCEERPRESLNRRRAGPRMERRLARWVRGGRVGRKVVVERVVLLINDHDVPDDRRRRPRRAGGRLHASGHDRSDRAAHAPDATEHERQPNPPQPARHGCQAAGREWGNW